MKNLVSIIVPIYNSEVTIERCIKSIINQTYYNIEIILIDDGSTDNTSLICKKYQAIDERIVYIKKENTGVSNTRNYGLNISKGKYIQFVDSDDYIDKNCTEKMVNSIEKNNADIVICGINIAKRKKKILNSINANNINSLKNEIYIFKDLINTGLLFYIWNKLYLKNKIINNFDETMTLGEDVIFNLNYLKLVNKVNIIDEGIYNYTLNEKGINIKNSSLNNKYIDGLLENSLYIYNSIIEFSKLYFENENTDGAFINYILTSINENIPKIVLNNNINKKSKINKIREYALNPQIRDILKDVNSKELLIRLLYAKKLNTIYYLIKFKYILKFIFEKLHIIKNNNFYSKICL